MDWDFYGQMIPHDLFDGQERPDEVVAAAFAPCALNHERYASGILLGSYRFGAGQFTLNTMPILDQLDHHPAADRLLVNLVNEAAALATGPVAPLPESFDGLLAAIGYSSQ